MIFKYPEALCQIICMIETLENFNQQLREKTKNKVSFIIDDSLIQKT